MSSSQERDSGPVPIEPGEATRPWVAKLWTLLLLLMLLWSSRETLLRAYGDFLVVSDAAPGADAVLVLAGDSLVRLPHAFDIIAAGYADHLLVTSPKPRQSKLQEYELNELQFARMVIRDRGLGIPVEAVPSRDGNTTSTLDEAHDLRVYAEAEGLRHVIAVTNACSSRRARFALRQAFDDSEILVQVSPAENEIFDSTNWWKSDKGIQCYILEPIKLAAYLLDYADPDWMRND